MRWDLFCRVIDNHGDVGVCWRLAAELAARGESVRLWLDDPSALGWMAPAGQAGVTVAPWSARTPALDPGDVVVEAFGCDPPQAFVASMAAARPAPAWINLEYLSAEAYVERSHGLPSPVLQGPGAGLVKSFCYPGFTARTGGLLRETDLSVRQASFDRADFLRAQGIAGTDGETLVSLFCYEPGPLPQLLLSLARGAATRLLVTEGRARAAVQAALLQLDGRQPGWNSAGRLRLQWLPLLTQRDYDHLLWACDVNFVRGEDSLVRGLLAGRPLVWQLYPQQDGAHHAKLDAFLDWLEPPASLRHFHAGWNGKEVEPLPAVDPAGWAPAASAALRKIQALPELTDQLLRLAGGRVRI